MLKRSPAYWNNIQNTSWEEIDDKLEFRKKAEDFWKDVSDEDNPSKMSLIEGLRGSGKSSFINILLKVIQEQKQDKFLPVLFTPWYIEPENFYKGFFEQLSSVLLQYKYFDSLESDISNLLDVLGSVDNKLNIFSTILGYITRKSKKTPNELIDSIVRIIKDKYKETLIIIVVDEVDRLSNEELHSIAKLLDMIKQISERCDNVFTFCAWSQLYLERQLIAGQLESKENPITYQEYCSRFIDYSWKLPSIEYYLLGELREYIDDSNKDSVYNTISDIIHHLAIGRMPFVMRHAKRTLYSLKNAIRNGLAYRIHKDDQGNSLNDNENGTFLTQLGNDGSIIILELRYRSVVVRYKQDVMKQIYIEMVNLKENHHFYDVYKSDKWSKDEDEVYKIIEDNRLYDFQDSRNKDTGSNWADNFCIIYEWLIKNDIKSTIEEIDTQITHKNISHDIEEDDESGIEGRVSYIINNAPLFFEGKDDRYLGSNGFDQLWKNYNKSHSTIAHYQLFLNFLLKLIDLGLLGKLKEMIDNYNAFSYNLRDIASTVVGVINFSREKNTQENFSTLYSRDMIENDIVSKFTDPFMKYLFIGSLYAFAIPEKGGYMEFTRHAREYRDGGFETETHIRIDGREEFTLNTNYQGSRWLGLLYIQSISEIVRSGSGTIDEGFVVGLSFDDDLAWRESRSIIYRLFEYKFLQRADQLRFVKRYFSDDCVIRMMYASCAYDLYDQNIAVSPNFPDIFDDTVWKEYGERLLQVKNFGELEVGKKGGKGGPIKDEKELEEVKMGIRKYLDRVHAKSLSSS